jgi:hypothetical protein
VHALGRLAVKVRFIMTIAQKTALHEQRLEDLQERIKEILGEHQRPLSLPEIEFFLQKARYDRGEPIEASNTFEVRDAIARLRRAGAVEETVGRNVQLVRE